jgi:hypothetical protein
MGNGARGRGSTNYQLGKTLNYVFYLLLLRQTWRSHIKYMLRAVFLVLINIKHNFYAKLLLSIKLVQQAVAQL